MGRESQSLMSGAPKGGYTGLDGSEGGSEARRSQPLRPLSQQYPQPPTQQMASGPAANLISHLGSVQTLAIKERVNKLEVAADLAGCCCINQENTYDVFDAVQGSKLMEVKEESSTCQRCFCKPNHAHKLNFKDPHGEHVMTVDKPFKCAGPCPAWLGCCQTESTLYNGTDVEQDNMILGKTREPLCGGCCIPKTEVFQGAGLDEFAVIEGPCCCFGGLTEMCFDQPFHVKNFEGGEVATIVKERPEGAKQALAELVSDADIYTLHYTDQVNPSQKAVLLSSLLLLDYMFFESGSAFECNPFEQSCTVTCCNMYLCGMLIPCKCKAGGKQDDN
eukprot:TRINITY_DN331_c0_g1_i2.p1 TRINITY_DN331_c0_g1~~TRINITY_DN331_c0_g1_i2.p1  ORF type:complete len:333 (+),score=132.65 TRINITY_DN331_c0_g1_i2:64-1062(+)